MGVDEDLRALDRRLLALAGELESPRDAGPIELEPDELGRIELELSAIAGEADSIAAALGAARLPEPVPALAAGDASEAHAALARVAAHVRGLIELTSAHDPTRAPVEAEQADDPAPRAQAGHRQRRLGFYAFVLALGSLPAGLGYAAAAHDRSKLQAAAAELCATEPPCPGDRRRVGYAHGRITPDERGEGRRRHHPALIVHQRGRDCVTHEERYYSTTGRLDFAGSVDDPDPRARARFLAQREAWARAHASPVVVDCTEAANLCGRFAWGCR